MDADPLPDVILPFKEVFQIVCSVDHKAPPTQLEGDVPLCAGEGGEVWELCRGRGRPLLPAQPLELV